MRSCLTTFETSNRSGHLIYGFTCIFWILHIVKWMMEFGVLWICSKPFHAHEITECCFQLALQQTNKKRYKVYYNTESITILVKVSFGKILNSEMPNAESQSNKTLSLSTVVIVFRAPFTCGNHYILSAGLKENRAAASWRSARESASWPQLSTGPSVFAQRGFVIVGPQALSAPPLTLSPKTQIQPRSDQEHTAMISVGDLSTPCRLRKVCYSSLFRLYVDGGCVKSIWLLILHFLDTPEIHQTYLGWPTHRP